jgi:hypothetical protein
LCRLKGDQEKWDKEGSGLGCSEKTWEDFCPLGMCRQKETTRAIRSSKRKEVAVEKEWWSLFAKAPLSNELTLYFCLSAAFKRIYL